jgi:hypothetical protein
MEPLLTGEAWLEKHVSHFNDENISSANVGWIHLSTVKTALAFLPWVI